jgi:hypothetical protein
LNAIGERTTACNSKIASQNLRHAPIRFVKWRDTFGTEHYQPGAGRSIDDLDFSPVMSVV